MSVALPAKTTGHIACSDDPLKFAGQYIDSVTFRKELGLATA
jgi:hypothetical protein